MNVLPERLHRIWRFGSVDQSLLLQVAALVSLGPAVSDLCRNLLHW